MPTYDYRCDACKRQFEIFQSMKDRPKRKCPECGEMKLQRLIGAGAGIIFKGSGFYETDYRSAEYKKKAEAEQGGGQSSGGEGQKSQQQKQQDGQSGGGASNSGGGAKSEKKTNSDGD